MAASEQLRALVNQMPNPDGRGMYCTDVDKDRIEKAVAEIHKGGRENILGLIDLLGEPGNEHDVKPHYALHCLANYLLQIKDDKGQADLSATLASQLASDRSTYVRGYLCQELQWTGRKEACPALGSLLTDEALVEAAAMALVAIRDGAAEQFRAALPKVKGKCRLNVIHGLAALADPQSIETFKQALADPDREVRIAAGAGLANCGDAASVEPLLQAADGEPGWERIQATKHCQVLAEKLKGAGNTTAASKIYTHLRDTRSDKSELYVREAAEKALRG
jgi:HEAT repeat protein